MELLPAWQQDLRAALGARPRPVEDVRVGVFFTAVRLAGGEAGLAYTPRALTDSPRCPRAAAEAPAAGAVAGTDAWALSGWAGAASALQRAIGVAVLNALSAQAARRHGIGDAHLVEGLDALVAADAGPDDRVAIVGAFAPFIKALQGRVARLTVIDKHPQALQPDESAVWRPPEQAAAVLGEADVVIISASALVEGGIDALLAAGAGARRVVLAGPSTPAWPAPFFACGVHVLAGLELGDPARLLQIVSEGGTGYLVSRTLRKRCIVRAGVVVPPGA